MNRFKQWYLKNHTEITWFLIGWLSIVGLQDLAKGQYINAAISFGLVALNFAFRSK